MTIAEILGQALLGWLIADLLSGLFHWWEDRVGRADWPVLGRLIIQPNRLHHTDVLAFTRHDLVSRNLPVWLVTAAIGAGWWLAFGPSVTLAVAVLGGLVVNEVHRLAHLPLTAGRIARVLQETGLLQSPRHHAGHHRTADRRYCILTDWLNPVLDAIGLWAAIEGVLDRVGLTPNRGTA